MDVPTEVRVVVVVDGLSGRFPFFPFPFAFFPLLLLPLLLPFPFLPPSTLLLPFLVCFLLPPLLLRVGLRRRLRRRPLLVSSFSEEELRFCSELVVLESVVLCASLTAVVVVDVVATLLKIFPRVFLFVRVLAAFFLPPFRFRPCDGDCRLAIRCGFAVVVVVVVRE